MKIKALKALVGDYGRLNKGEEIDLPKHIASQLLASGYVELVIEPEQTVRRKGKKNG
ncbi:hypothetical protein KEM44_23265 [Sinorhizobium meliloti]|uniref:hypothetical protein n=1 Tax=Rhizobium meliloti TaxID=382 RepID=UPI0012FDD643|nr:hypothetical protein [Sinorhizobium meliloti]MCK3783074.1 hypothetical protein [Sinorhizobium meliloti]MCK3788296.1 hypothetical protein [Sinorhizobium meliloti]MCK3794427.1 hypothetical protein [Sinorhizobium meliloti]UTG96524.1 hypothetical protein KEM44_23265 [Sinorhizobium meliloti]